MAFAGLRRWRFFLHLAEFLDAIRPGSFPKIEITPTEQWPINQNQNAR
jgi:hypothetical protein